MRHITCLGVAVRTMVLGALFVATMNRLAVGQKTEAVQEPPESGALAGIASSSPDWHASHQQLLNAYFEHRDDTQTMSAITAAALGDAAAPNRRLALEIADRARLIDLIPMMRTALSDPDDTVRGTAALALARLADTRSQARVSAVFESTPATSWLHRRALAALVVFEDSAGLGRLQALLDSPHADERTLGAHIVQLADSPVTEPALAAMQVDETPLGTQCVYTPDGARLASVTVGDMAGAALSAWRGGDSESILEAGMSTEDPPRTDDQVETRHMSSMAGQDPACDTHPNEDLSDWGYVGSGAELAPERTSMPFYIDSSYQVPPDWLLDVLFDAAAAWNEVTTSRYIFDYQGFSFEPDHLTSGQVRFMPGNGSGQGMPFTSYYPDGNKYKTGFQVTLTYGGSANMSWYMHLARHELGHAQGLAHSTSPANVMVSGMAAYEIGQGDIDGVTALHPDSNRRPVARLAAPLPVAGGSPLTVTLDATSSFDPDGAALDYTFFFGDGTPPLTTAEPLVSHTYVLPAGVEQQSFSVQLMVCDQDGFVDYWTDQLNGQTLTVTVDQCGAPVSEEQDCNANAVRDDCEIQDGLASDCDANGIPDDCQSDCNTNGVADACDISSGTSEDCTGNGVPDECEPDCDGNGIADVCALAAGSLDCNGNGRPDHCDLDDGSTDCNNDGTPDECQVGGVNDCDLDGLSDLCALASGQAVDADHNGIPDHCDSCAALNCGDDDNDGSRDSPCLWWGCSFDGVISCTATPRQQADVGGQYGACGPDGVVDLNDWFHTLNCFANSAPDGGHGYGCEPHAPNAINVDVGGPFAGCVPDGICDMHDAYHVRSTLDGESECACAEQASGPSEFPGGEVELTLRPLQHTVVPGGLVNIEVVLDQDVDDLRAFQLHFDLAGGRRGQIEVVDMTVADGALDGVGVWSVFNVSTAQLAAGVTSAGTGRAGGTVLARLTVRLSDDAFGRFYVDVLHDTLRNDHRTFLLPTDVSGRIDIAATRAAVINVRSMRRPGLGRLR